MDKAQFKNTIAPQLPHKPGVYKFIDKKGRMLYIGKAKDLKKRVISYFNKQQGASPKTTLLVRKIDQIDFTLVNSEEDALLLENSLIKKHQPKYNVMFRDDKTYPFICLKNERFPRLFATRDRKEDGSEYFGPYTSMRMVKTLVELLRKIFKIRTCHYNLSQKNIEKKKFRVCLEYHINNCKGPCEGLHTEENYNENIEHIRDILKGNIQSVIRYLKEMKAEYAKNYQFELAQEMKEKLALLDKFKSKSTVVNPRIKDVDVFSVVNDNKRAFVNYLKIINGAIIQTQTLELKKGIEESQTRLLTTALIELRKRYKSNAKEIIVPFNIDVHLPGIKVTVPKIGDKKKLLDLSFKNARYFQQYRTQSSISQKKAKKKEEKLKTIQNDLSLKNLPKYIECFDNSNIQGSTPVAGLVVFKDGKPLKKEYRHYNIKTVEGPDDFASMTEVVHRRYSRLIQEQHSLPQLIIVDGGKGQLNAACQSLEQLDIAQKVDIIAIAKRLEKIYKPGDSYPYYVDKTSYTLKLIQQIRNEAHRFAVNFHRHKRQKSPLKSELEQINGIGQKTSNQLLKSFGSVKKVKNASLNELAEVIGEHRAQLVHQYYKKS